MNLLIVYLIGIILAYIFLGHKDWQKALEESMGNLIPVEDSRKIISLLSWFIIIIQLKWIFKELIFQIKKRLR